MPEAVLALEDLGIIASFGKEDSGDLLEVLQKPIDAAFVGTDVAILDASPPWVRVFSRGGRILRGFSRSGDGPGEARQPVSLAGTVDGEILLSHLTGIEGFASDGRLQFTLRTVNQRIRGTFELCNSEVLAFLERPGLTVSGALVRLSPEREIGDTLLVLDSLRRDTRTFHPLLADSGPEGVVFYTEEENRNRLLLIDCGGEVVRELTVDSLGPGKVYKASGDGFLIGGPRPPHPAGIARIDDIVVWFTRAILPRSDSGTDSVTVVTALDMNGRQTRQLRIAGWYQLLDADHEGKLLLTNSWTLGMNWRYSETWGLFPAVFLIDGNDLLSRVLE